MLLPPLTGLLSWHNGNKSICQCRRCKRQEFHLWVGKIPRRRKWQLAPVFLPVKFHGQRSLTGCSLWGRKDIAKCKRTHAHIQTRAHAHTHMHTHIPHPSLKELQASGFIKIYYSFFLLEENENLTSVSVSCFYTNYRAWDLKPKQIRGFCIVIDVSGTY